jgi:hypothetical protein
VGNYPVLISIIKFYISFIAQQEMDSRTIRYKMTRFWFEFEYSRIEDLPHGTSLGCGVSAFNYPDALSILKKKVFKGRSIPPFRKEIENIDIRTLDQGHVTPNMGDPTLRGVWWPLGHE